MFYGVWLWLSGENSAVKFTVTSSCVRGSVWCVITYYAQSRISRGKSARCKECGARRAHGGGCRVLGELGTRQKRV